MLKKCLSCMLAFLLVLASLPAEGLFAFASGSKATVDFVYGNDGKITRAEWLHDLALLFDMQMDESAEPDNYFNDLEKNHPYYHDILSAVEFGVVDVEAGGMLLPDETVTRDYAATTLNFCLGYQLEPNADYTYGDFADCSDPVAAQIALNRNWFAPIDNAFSPETPVTEQEIRRMIDDVTTVLSSIAIEEDYKSTYHFDSDVKMVPNGTTVSEKDGLVQITDCPFQISEGDRFAVYYNEIPSVYTALRVTTDGILTEIETQSVETEDAFREIDAQGKLDGGDILIEGIDGAEVEVEEESDGISTYGASGSKKITNINVKKSFDMKGFQVAVNVKIKNPVFEYLVNSYQAYVSLSGDTEVTYSISTSLSDVGLGGISTIDLLNCTVPGIGGLTVSVKIDLSGKAAGTVKGELVAGLSCEKNVGIRTIYSFRQSEHYYTAEASASIALKASFGVTQMPVIKAYVYAEVGAIAQVKYNKWQDDSPPHACTHFAAWIYAKYGLDASASFAGWSTSYNKDYDIYKESNSPVRVVHHYEDGIEVAKCTRGAQYSYYTRADSHWGGSGWYYADGAYGLDASGSRVPLYTYTVTEGNAVITKYNGNSSFVNIPETIDGYTVVGIGNSAFANKDVVRVVIPDSVTSIENSAFEYCSQLSTISLPPNLENLGGAAFEYCTSLEKINIPKSIRSVTGFSSSIWKGPFAFCSNLKEIEFETGIAKVKNNLFEFCDGLENITIPDTVTTIENNAFYSCPNLKTVTVSNSVTSIENSAFEYCSQLSTISLPPNLENLGGAAFEYCTSLEKINIPKSIRSVTGFSSSIWKGPFAFCSNLKEIEFETGIAKVKNNLFEFCDGLENITIPDTVTTIENNAFYSCPNLKTVTVSDSVTSIENSAFAYCSSLSDIIVPDSVKSLGGSVFTDCTQLKKAVLPAHLTSIPSNTFSNCAALYDFSIPDSVTSIGEHAFEGCESLTEITFPKSVESIYSKAFWKSGVEHLQFPEGSALQDISTYAFAECPALKTVHLPDGIKTVKSGAFSSCGMLREVSLPQSLKTLGYGAFMADEQLANVSISDYTIETIESDTFKGCSSLAGIILPKGLKTIGDHAFMNDVALTDVTIPESVQSISPTAFSYPTRTTIRGHAGSYAESFATDGGYPFVDITVPVEGIALLDGSEEVTMDRGETWRAKFEFFPEEANDVVVLTADNNYVSISGHDITARYTGDTVITATATSGVSCEFTIHIRSANGIKIAEQPQKTDYLLGDSFEPDGMKVLACYPDGSTREVTDYTVSGFDSSKEGDCTVTIEWRAPSGNRYTTQFTVRITDPRPKVTGIKIERLPDQLLYTRREALNLTGLIVLVTLTDGSTEPINDYTYTGYNVLKTGLQTVTIHYNGFTADFTVRTISGTPGDTNGDYSVDGADLSALRRDLLGESDSDFQADAGDLNGDGVLDIRDLVRLRNHLAKTEPSSQPSAVPTRGGFITEFALAPNKRFSWASMK